MRFRDYKENSAGAYFHIYNRGNRGEPVFLDDEDYYFFLLRLKQNIYPQEGVRMRCLPSQSFSILSYNLLPNHFHLLIRQNKEYSVSQLLLRICTSYSIYFNKKYDKIGHTFQDQFKQKHIDSDSYIKWLSAYINQNSKLHGVTNDSANYKWGSYREYLNYADVDRICDTSILLDFFNRDPLQLVKFMEDNYCVLQQNKELKSFCHDN